MIYNLSSSAFAKVQGEETMKNRWVALTIIFVSFLQLTLNWFAVIPAFSQLIAQMHIALAGVGLIIAAFIAGYGLAHIPGGLIAEAFGMRSAILLGIFLETLGAVISAKAPDFDILLLGRFICGIGGSIYIGSAIGLTAAWFRNHELVTATAIVTGVAFTVGAALGLFAWVPITAALGWRDALMCGAGVGAATFLFMLIGFPTPLAEAGEGVGGHHLDVSSLRRVFLNKDLWLLGCSFLGGYGAYFTAAQLLPEYAIKHLAVSATMASTMGVVLLIGGIPGSFIGGWLSDLFFGVLPTFLGACLIETLALLLIPALGQNGLLIDAAVIGVTGIVAFVGWVAMPGMYAGRIKIADIPTAAGLMLTIAAVGGVGVPSLFGRIADSYGYTAGWLMAAAICLVTALISLIVRRPAMVREGEAVVPAFH